jgi:uncharacterized protein YlxW (UPF0749 family)
MRRHRRRQPRTVRGKAAAVRVGGTRARRGEHASVVSTRSRIVSWVCVFLICLLAGWLIATNLHFNGGQDAPKDVESLITQREQRVRRLRGDISRLGSEIDSINKAVGQTGSSTGTDDDDAGSASVLPALTGPGLSVTLDDSPLWEDATRSGDNTLAGRDVNDYVVHQQDIEAVINALWTGGAEAMTIQGERVLPTTAVRCVGNVLLLRGRQYAPPYTVSAIGPVAQMRRSLDSSPSVKIYKEYVDAVGLGWKVKESDSLHFARTPGDTTSLDYATAVPENTSKNDSKDSSKDNKDSKDSTKTADASADKKGAGR